jgi:hypothetical protein
VSYLNLLHGNRNTRHVITRGSSLFVGIRSIFCSLIPTCCNCAFCCCDHRAYQDLKLAEWTISRRHWMYILPWFIVHSAVRAGSAANVGENREGATRFARSDLSALRSLTHRHSQKVRSESASGQKCVMTVFLLVVIPSIGS